MSKQHRVRIGRLPRSMTKLPANAWNASLRRKDILLKYELFLFLVTAYTKVTLIIKNVKIDKETKDSSPQTRYDFFFIYTNLTYIEKQKSQKKKKKCHCLLTCFCSPTRELHHVYPQILPLKRSWLFGSILNFEMSDIIH